jgi:hypothetical protein
MDDRDKGLTSIRSWHEVSQLAPAALAAWVTQERGLEEQCAARASAALVDAKVDGLLLLRYEREKLKVELAKHGLAEAAEFDALWKLVQKLLQPLRYKAQTQCTDSSGYSSTELVAEVLAQNFQFAHDQAVLQPSYFDFVHSLVLANQRVSKNDVELPSDAKSGAVAVNVALDFLTNVFLKCSSFKRPPKQVESWRALLTKKLLAGDGLFSRACTTQLLRNFSDPGLATVMMALPGDSTDGSSLVCEAVCAAVKEVPAKLPGPDAALELMSPIVDTIVHILRSDLRDDGPARNLGAICQVRSDSYQPVPRLSSAATLIWRCVHLTGQVLYTICDTFKPSESGNDQPSPVWRLLYDKQALQVFSSDKWA